jgi:polysaccharide export outer membrane protein
VLGGVVKPGVYPMQGRQDLMTALLQAGGPSDRAKLGEIKLIRPRESGPAETMKIDLEKYLNHGDLASNPPLRPGDTVSVGRKGFTSQELTVLLAIVTSMATLALLYYSIQDEANNSPN